MNVKEYTQKFLADLSAKHQAQPEFHQAAREVVESLVPCLERSPHYIQHKVLERVAEPDRIFMFRVPWLDDKGEIQVNRGFRVEFSNAIGPYKGGLRFHPTVNLGILKFLGFEQIFKNSLTTLPMGGGKGGADFDPKGKSDNEVMKFCQSFMSELYKHIGADVDVPAGDIGVGGREIGYMFGWYKKLTHSFEGVLTGKGLNWGGSLIRPEATGYGCVYFADEMLGTRGQSFKGKTVTVSGSGNVAQYAIEKVTQLGGKAITCSDSAGTIHDPDGIDAEKLAFVMDLKNRKRGRIKEYAQKYTKAQYLEAKRPWAIKCDVALPCATQNEVEKGDAETLAKNGCICVAEGANMPTTIEGAEVFLAKKVLYGPGKAANAGGVATSGLEMSQNSMRMLWSRKEVDDKLKGIMHAIHTTCATIQKEYNAPENYIMGANIGGFVKVADAMIDQGLV